MLWVRVALVAFVIAWLFDVGGMRGPVPVWLPFLVVLGLEVNLLVAALRGPPAREHDRLPQEVDRDDLGYGAEPETEEELEALFEPTGYVQVARRGPLRRFVLGLGLLAALGGVVWWAGGTGWSGLDGETQLRAAARLSEEASRIAEKRVEIRCDESGDYVGAVQHADGVAIVGGEIAWLTPERCYDLYRLAFEGEVTYGRTARAVAVLAHEAWHLRGERDEGVTECYAFQSGVELGTRLGLDELTARQMMRQQLVENRLRREGAFEYLVPAECRAGGELDLDPGRAEFP